MSVLRACCWLLLVAIAGCGGGSSSKPDGSPGGDGGGDDGGGIDAPVDGGPPVVPGIDPTFGNDGLALANFGPGTSALVAVARQSDGKLVGVGGTREGLVVARVDGSGTFDPTFGDAGIVQLPWGVATGGIDRSFDVAIQPDGKIVVAATITALYGGLESHGVVARFTAVGVLDTTFAGTGWVLGPDFTNHRALELQADGKILVAGIAGVTRYLADGSLDAGFGENGLARIDSGVPEDLALQADGKIVVAGGRSIVRLTSAGMLDTTFNGTGRLVVPSSGGDVLQGVAVQGDGKVLVCGALTIGGVGPARFAVARYGATGTLDTAFGDNGFAHDSSPSSTFCAGVALMTDGRIVGVGFANLNGTSQGRSVRLTADGDFDATYGGDGIGPVPAFVVNGNLVLEADGAFTTAGFTGGAGSFMLAFARTGADGEMVTSFGTNGVAGRQAGGSFDRAYRLAVMPNGSIVAGGFANGGAGLTRFDATGQLDQSFHAAMTMHRLGNSALAWVSDMVAQGDKLVVTGPTISGGYSIVRLDPAGQLDATWGTQGVVRAEPFAGQRAISRAIVKGNDGSLFVAGSTGTAANVEQFAVVKLSGAGVRDTTYGTASTTFATGRHTVTHAVAGLNGEVVVLGQSQTTTTQVTVARFTSAGVLDAAFGVGGVASWRASPANRDPFALAAYPDGKLLVVTGWHQTGALEVVRLAADGTLDTTFGVGGITTIVSPGGNDFFQLGTPMGLAILGDGSIIVAGAASSADRTQQHSMFVRMSATGVLDETFGPGGVATYELGRGSSAFHAMTPAADGKLLVGGRVWTEAGSSDFSILRLLP